MANIKPVEDASQDFTADLASVEEKHSSNVPMRRQTPSGVRSSAFRNSFLGVVTLSNAERERPASRIFSSDRDGRTPHVHCRRAKGSVRSC